jgi:hypothetical protein
MINKRLRDEVSGLVTERVRFREAVAFGHKSRFREFIDIRRRRCGKSLNLGWRQAEAVLDGIVAKGVP